MIRLDGGVSRLLLLLLLLPVTLRRRHLQQVAEQRLCAQRRRVLEVVRLVADERIEFAALHELRLALVCHLIIHEQNVARWQRLTHGARDRHVERAREPTIQLVRPRGQHRLRADNQDRFYVGRSVDAANSLNRLAEAHFIREY